ncbi:hypothetical protein Hanom_Chr13g01203251 [Helianthus anomalus]
MSIEYTTLSLVEEHSVRSSLKSQSSILMSSCASLAYIKGVGQLAHISYARMTYAYAGLLCAYDSCASLTHQIIQYSTQSPSNLFS